MAMTKPKSSQIEHRGETVQKVIDDITQEDGVLTAEASWVDVPKLKGANANKQAQSLVNRTDVLKEGLLNLESLNSVNLSTYSNDTDGFNNAINDAINKDAVVVVNTDSSVSAIDMTNKTTQVTMIGGGRVVNAYRKFVTPSRRAQYIPKNTIHSSQHLKMLGSSPAPVAVILGDSISSDGPDSHVKSNSLWGIIKEKLQQDNPSKSFTFYNRAIGGQTWLTANTKPTAFPFWYTDQNKDWLEYVEELQPDILFLAFGMNDSNGFNTGGMLATVSKIKAWVKVPDLVFVTNPVPARAAVYPDGNGTGFAQQVYQEGRDLVAGFERTYALANGHGLIDINRMFVASRDSYDVHAGTLLVKEDFQNNKAKFTAATEAIDFSISGLVSGEDFIEGRALSVKCGQHANDFIFLRNSDGKFVFSGFTNSLATYAEINTNVTIPAAAFFIEVSVVGGVARLAFTTSNGESTSILGEFSVIRHGGLFSPVVSWQGIESSPFITIKYASSYGECYKQTVTDEDVWGASDISPSIKPVTGGNGINHYSAGGLQHIVRPVIEALDFSCGQVSSGIHNGWKWVKRDDGTSECTLRVGYNGSIAAAVGGIFVSSASVEKTDFPAIFKSLSDGGLDFTTDVDVITAGAKFAWKVSAGSTTLNNAVRFRIACAESVEQLDAVLVIKLTGWWK